MYKYKAFGFIIDSEIPLLQVPETVEEKEADVRIVFADLSQADIPADEFKIHSEEISFSISDLGYFRVTGANLIEVDPIDRENTGRLTIFLMGSCMGAIIHQRDLLPIHGSCVTDGNHSVIITGDSGAGKSTLASEFLSHGWKLVTDDVAVIKDIDGTPLVQSSYPSQKLWEDAMNRYEMEEDRVHSLYERDQREKYGINVADMFIDGVVPLSAVVRLIPYDGPTMVDYVEGFAKMDQLLKNTYRLFFILEDKRQAHFQKCVTLGNKIAMLLAVRNKEEQSATKLYNAIVEKLEEK